MVDVLNVQVITPRSVVFSGEAVSVTIPSEAGEMQVFHGHIPVLARIQSGIIRIEQEGTAPVSFEVEEGFFRIAQNEVSLLMDTCKKVDEALG